MMKLNIKNSVLVLTALGFAACGGTATTNTTTTNVNVTKPNSNTAVVVDSNSTNSNMMSNSNSAAPGNMNNSNMSKNVSSADKDFINKAAQGGMAEVKLGELAMSKAQSSDVKDYGKMMASDHTKANDELKTLAVGKSVTLPVDLSAEHKQLFDKLSKLSGAEFDKAYMKAMVEDHEKDVAEFTKQSQSGTDSEVKSFATKTLPTLKSHLDTIKALSGKLK